MYFSLTFEFVVTHFPPSLCGIYACQLKKFVCKLFDKCELFKPFQIYLSVAEGPTYEYHAELDLTLEELNQNWHFYKIPGKL